MNYNTSSTNSNYLTYSDRSPVMFYDNLSGSMRECAGQIIMGNCNNFAPYNSSSYNFNTLFYNPSTGAMQRCANHRMGKCLSFRPSSRIYNSEQLFYNPRTKRMTRCLNSNSKGQCLSFGSPPSISIDTGSYVVDDKSNPYYNFPEIMLNICLIYYHIMDKWDKQYIGDFHKL